LALIDLHCHLLPGIDDGPATIDQTIEQLREAHEAGIRSVAATSHLYRPPFASDPAMIERSFAATCKAIEAAAAHDPRLREVALHPGAEHFVSPELLAALDQGRVVTINGAGYLLIEFSTFLPPPQIVATAEQVIGAGLRPLIAHVERYPSLLEETKALDRLASLGCAIQVNAESLLRTSPRRLRNACLRLFKNGHAHVVASDSHGPGSSAPRLPEAVAMLRRKFSAEQAKRWSETNPARILAGEPL
jgi:protein-tyrosine phosphatase